ncbi:Peptidoglycan glycosyltransferase [Catenulispora acidiphila DSM 44928]|uniref:Peptidoglycan glycosyltransferase n=1 Tax=Catenulispora acidiphila (strain DSM 44928 / JCM 14897 / NBRC 102108 / NRRL B-24433 / ID139908) TaxID=479433 RepID=C7QBK0_CATAD|nr:penicillin-binding protein 2 [Catenulispora acidiphila]ACU70577.1 Peptidoglycan glycosyltransferase [Catenulispora acidiphila DSM 44928]
MSDKDQPEDPRPGRPQRPADGRDGRDSRDGLKPRRPIPPGARPHKTAVRQLPPRRPTAGASPAPARPRPPGPRTPTLRMGSPRRRLRVTMFGLLFAFSLFAGRLFQLQAVDAGGYAQAAATGREATAVLHASRGAILAADGTPLAVSVEAYDVTADPTVVARYHEDVDELAGKLAGLLSSAPEYAQGGAPSVSDLQAALTKADTRYVVLAHKASPATCAKIRALAVSNTSDPKTVVGVYTNTRDDRRTYPGGTLAANVIGFTDSDGAGKAGIEQMLNARLAGKDGQESYQAASGVEIPTTGVNMKPAVDGESVKTTIDPDIQWAADQALSQEVKKTGSLSGTVVVEDVKTGQILALSNYPSFDPRHITSADVPNLGNRAFTDPFEPGSVAKVITMSAAIQTGVGEPDTQLPPFTSPQHVGRYIFKDDVDHGPWSLTMTGVLAASSNVGTIEVADLFQQHGVDRDQTIGKYQRLFGFGQKTGIGFPGESAGLLDPPAKWSDTERYTVLYGQGLAATAVQDASVYQTIANGGVRIAPSLIQGYTDASGKYTPAPAPQQTPVVSAATASKVADMLEAVTTSQRGTGTTAQIPGYRVAGKTGTANRYDEKKGTYNGYTASFIGFAPTDKPQIVVAVSLQAPVGAHFGAEIAAPVFTQVMSFAMQSRGVAPTDTPPADLPTTYGSGH